MNIFYLHYDPEICVKWYCDSHVRKMVVEYPQMLCTCLRFYNHVEKTKHKVIDKHGNEKWKDVWRLEDEYIDSEGFLQNKQCYIQSYVNHPANIWVRESSRNYTKLYCLWHHLLREYEFRFKKKNATESLFHNLNLFMWIQETNYEFFGKIGTVVPRMFKEWNLTIPDYNDRIHEYRQYYLLAKKHLLHAYTKREIPYWIHDNNMESC